jgi:predicted ribosome quality control (RQC) complex YloA/Tae2 family protein
MRPVSSLIGGRVRRIDLPQPELLTLVFAVGGGRMRTARDREPAEQSSSDDATGPERNPRDREPAEQSSSDDATGPERGVLLICFAPGAYGVGIVAERPQGNPADAFVQKLRKELENGRIDAFEQREPATLVLAIQRGPERRRLACDFAAALIELFDADGTSLARYAPDVPAARRARLGWPATLEELEARGPELLRDRAESALERRRSQLAKLLRSGEKRLERRLSALAEDIARVAGAEPLRARANLLLQNQHLSKRGQSSVSVTDYTRDPPAIVEIELDQTRPPREQIEAWFKQARRYERGAELAQQRTVATRAELDRLRELRGELGSADAAALEQIAQNARSQGVRGIAAAVSSSAKAKASARRHKPYRELRGHGQRPILVGKNAEDNDILTRDHARPHDLWLHARDNAGAHVVVPLERNETCPQELLLDAAHLAAHFSEARQEPVVDIAYTQKRHVHKPRKAPKGTVHLTLQKILHLKPDPTRLTQLLSTELRD